MSTDCIDLIIPVYRGVDSVRACLDSVYTAVQRQPFEIILINDASPEPEIWPLLEAYAKRPHTILLEHTSNLGFVKSVNQAMECHSERDVLILNSDTQVSGNWLDRIKRCAYSDVRIGTVTPFSNNATICSYPFIEGNNPLPKGWSLKSLDHIFYKCNSGESITIPTGVGFCMFIKRACLRDVGLFSTEFGHGYGEENDFCMRASAQGWIHKLAADVFVYHKGRVSFGVGAESMQRQAADIIERLQPGYHQSIGNYLLQDSARSFRIRVSRSIKAHDTLKLFQSNAVTYSNRAKKKFHRKILHVVNTVGGGALKYINDLINFDSSHDQHAVLILSDTQFVICSDHRYYLFNSPTNMDEIIELLARMLLTLGINLVHIHSLSNISINLINSKFKYDLPPFIVTLHDIGFFYHNVFFRDTLNKEDPTDKEWREYTRKALDLCYRVIAPSNYIANLATQLPLNAPPIVISHGIECPSSICMKSAAPNWPKPDNIRPGAIATVGVIGALGPHKGAHELELILSTPEGNLIRWIIIGYMANRLIPEVDNEKGIIIHGPYLNEQLCEIIDHYKIELAFFPNRMPESYSYTLSEAWCCGIPVFAPSAGAFLDRISYSDCGWLYSTSLSGSLLARELLAIVSDKSKLKHARQVINEKKSFIVSKASTMSEKTRSLYPNPQVDQRTAESMDQLTPEDIEKILAQNIDDNLFRKELIRLGNEILERHNEINQLRIELNTIQSHYHELQAWELKLQDDIESLRQNAENFWNEILCLRSEKNALESEASILRLESAALKRLPRWIQKILKYKLVKK